MREKNQRRNQTRGKENEQKYRYQCPRKPSSVCDCLFRRVRVQIRVLVTIAVPFLFLIVIVLVTEVLVSVIRELVPVLLLVTKVMEIVIVILELIRRAPLWSRSGTG